MRKFLHYHLSRPLFLCGRSFSSAESLTNPCSLCMATIWVADTTSADYQRCWQTSGLGGIIGTGKGQISYKGACSGTCGSSYINA